MRQGYLIAVALALASGCGPEATLYTPAGNEPAGPELPAWSPVTRCEQEEAGLDAGRFELDARACAELFAPPVVDAGGDVAVE